MFASKSERKVHYSIRKFSIGVASVVVASLFLGGVVHAEEVRRGNNLTVTSSGDEVESHYQSILEKVRKSLEKDRHTQNVDLIKKLQDIKRTYLYKLDNSTKETPKSRVRRNSPQVGDSRELKETIDKAKETLSTYMVTRLTKLDPSVFWFADLLMDAKKVVEEYKTKLEDASDKKSVEDLRKEAEGKIESLIVTHQNREKENQPAPQPGGQAGGSMVVPPVTQTPPSTSQSPGQKATEAEKKKLQDLIRQFQEALNKLDDETKTVPDGAKLTGEAGKAYNETRTYAKEVVDKSKKLLSQTAVTMDELAMQLTKLNDAMSKLKEAKAKLVPEVKPQPENPEPKPQPEGEKPSVPDINQEKEKAKLAIATYMSKILDDIKKHHLKKEKHHQIVALIKDLDKLKKQALSEIDNVNTKVEIENTVHKVFADMDAVVTKFKKGLTQDTPKEPGNKKPSAPKPGMQPSPQPEVKPQLEKPKPEVKPQPEKPKPEVKPQLEKPKPEVKPQPEKPKPEVKPQPEKPKPEVKPQLEKPKPEVKPQLEKPKPDNSKPQADDKKPSTTNNLSKDKQPSNQASTNEKATNKPKKSLPSTGSISNLALEIAGLLTLAGATILAKKRMK